IRFCIPWMLIVHALCSWRLSLVSSNLQRLVRRLGAFSAPESYRLPRPAFPIALLRNLRHGLFSLAGNDCDEPQFPEKTCCNRGTGESGVLSLERKTALHGYGLSEVNPSLRLGF